MSKSIIVAFGTVPKDGGTFTFYRNLRPAIQEYGIDLRCVAVGKDQAGLWEDAYADDGCVLLASGTRNVKKQAMAFAQWCEQAGVDIVMGINSEAILSSLPHLPEKVRVLSRCANAFDHGYKITMACAERLAAIIATTPRLEHDLVQSYGADRSKVCLIPNGIAPDPFEGAAAAPRGQESLLRLAFLGRLEHNQKGVFHLPEIVGELNRLKVPFKLRIAGKGKHRSVLEQAMKDEIQNGQVELLGAIAPIDIPAFFTETDLFLFTSHFEGCPNALLEALMAGSVPISWLIEGITDFIIDEGTNGILCPMGETTTFARKIAELSTDRDRLQAMSLAAAGTARKRFSNRRAAVAYAQLFQEVMGKYPPPWIPVAWSDFTRDPNFEHSWREFIPKQMRTALKTLIR